MTIREFFQHRWSAGSPAFQRVVHAMPLAQLAYSPHSRSPSAAQILWTLGLEAKVCSELIDARQSKWEPDAPAADPDTIVSAFETHTADLGERIARLDETGVAEQGSVSGPRQSGLGGPLGELLWYMFFDSIHHRGQLSTYIRTMGGKVPSIYGPSETTTAHRGS